MLTKEEKGFIEYWEQHRLRKKKVWRQLSVGLPLGVALGGGILVNLYSGWNPAGTIVFNSGFLILLLAIILIVIFVVIFSAHHRWDMNEQHYKELLAKKDKS